MSAHKFVEIRLVCKADYLDPQLKSKLHKIRNKLREILHTGRRKFALKKIQPWNSVKVTFDIPKDAADRLRLLAMEGNIRLIDLGIISIEIVGQSNTILVNNPSTKTTPDDHHSKPMKTTPSDSWSGYKMKINGVHYYPSQRYEKRRSSSDS